MSSDLCFLLLFSTVLSSPPGPPRNVTVTSVGDNFLVQWEPPLHTYGPLLHYQVIYDVIPTVTEILTVDKETMFAIIPDVNKFRGALYRVQVRGENSDGLGAASLPRYTRTECIGNYDVSYPRKRLVQLPEQPMKQVALILCKWTLSTNQSYGLNLNFTDFNFSTKNDQSCRDTYIDVLEGSTHTKICHPISLSTKLPNVTLTLHTSQRSTSASFSLVMTSIVPKPNPPEHITLQLVGNHVILVSWQSPLYASTSHITAYRLHYDVMPKGVPMVVTLPPTLHSYPINTHGYAGQLLRVQMSAMHAGLESDLTTPSYIRSACFTEIYLSNGEARNITSPNYPSPYPAGSVCTWKVISASVSVKFRIVAMEIEESLFCSHDYIMFEDEPKNRRCGTITSPEDFQDFWGELTFKFISDEIREFKGFVLEVHSVLFSTESSRTSVSIESSYPSTVVYTNNSQLNLTSIDLFSNIKNMPLTTLKTVDNERTSTVYRSTTFGHTSTVVASLQQFENVLSPSTSPKYEVTPTPQIFSKTISHTLTSLSNLSGEPLYPSSLSTQHKTPATSLQASFPSATFDGILAPSLASLSTPLKVSEIMHIPSSLAASTTSGKILSHLITPSQASSEFSKYSSQVILPTSSNLNETPYIILASYATKISSVISLSTIEELSKISPSSSSSSLTSKIAFQTSSLTMQQDITKAPPPNVIDTTNFISLTPTKVTKISHLPSTPTSNGQRETTAMPLTSSMRPHSESLLQSTTHSSIGVTVNIQNCKNGRHHAYQQNITLYRPLVECNQTFSLSLPFEVNISLSNITIVNSLLREKIENYICSHLRLHDGCINCVMSVFRGGPSLYSTHITLTIDTVNFLSTFDIIQARNKRMGDYVSSFLTCLSKLHGIQSSVSVNEAYLQTYRGSIFYGALLSLQPCDVIHRTICQEGYHCVIDRISSLHFACQENNITKNENRTLAVYSAQSSSEESFDRATILIVVLVVMATLVFSTVILYLIHSRKRKKNRSMFYNKIATDINAPAVLLKSSLFHDKWVSFRAFRLLHRSLSPFYRTNSLPSTRLNRQVQKTEMIDKEIRDNWGFIDDQNALRSRLQKKYSSQRRGSA